MTRNTSWGRRDFLSTSLTALVGTRFSTGTLRQIALAAGRKGCPALTVAALNERFATYRDPELFKREAMEAQQSLAGYLDNHFYLTPVQMRSVQALPAEDIKAFNTALDQAVQRNLAVRIGRAEATDQSGCQKLSPRLTDRELVIDLA